MADWLRLVEVLVTSWPLAVVIAILVFHKPLSELLNSLRNVNVLNGKLTAEFEKVHELAKKKEEDQLIQSLPNQHTAERHVAELPVTYNGNAVATRAVPKNPGDRLQRRVADIALRNPFAAIDTAWRQVQRDLSAATARSLGADMVAPDLPESMADALLSEHLLDGETFRLVMELAIVMHALPFGSEAVSKVTYRQALDFGSLAAAVVNKLATVKAATPQQLRAPNPPAAGAPGPRSVP